MTDSEPERIARAQAGTYKAPASPSMRLVAGIYGKVRIVEGLPGYGRLYVKRTNVKTYVLSESERLSLDSMVELGGEYHFTTLKAIRLAIANVR